MYQMEEFDNIVKHTFKKSERLSSQKDIKELFANGSSFYLYPFKVVYSLAGSGASHKVLFSVPKRVFKRAVDRNLLKRRMREAYRLHKHQLQIQPQILNIAYIYTPKKILRFKALEEPMVQSINRLAKYVDKSS